MAVSCAPSPSPRSHRVNAGIVSVRLRLHLAVCPSIHPSSLPSVFLCFLLSIGLSILPSTHSSFFPFLQFFFLPSILPSAIHPSIHPSTPPSIHLSMHPPFRSPSHPLIHPSFFWPIHLSVIPPPSLCPSLFSLTYSTNARPCSKPEVTAENRTKVPPSPEFL